MITKTYNKLYDLNSWSFKALRIIPGVLTLFILTSPIWASVVGSPQLVLYYITFLAVFWVFKSATASIGNFIAYDRLKKGLANDWNKEIEKITWENSLATDYLPKKYDDFYHAVIIPFYKEEYDVLHGTISSLAESEYDCKKKVFLILAVEESGGENAQEVAKKIKLTFQDSFKDIRFYTHPKDIPGEVKGIAGANLRFAAKNFVEEIKAEGYKTEDILMTKYDSDLRVHKKFISALTHKYLATPDRYHCFFSPVAMLYSNNYWDVPILIRVIAGSITLALFSEWVTSKKTKQSFSCYSFNLNLLESIDYWDPRIGVDDTGFFWNAYLHLDGRFRGEEFYALTYSDAVHAGDMLKSHIAQYKQLHRWGWGVIVFPMTLQGLIRNNAIPVSEKIGSVVNLFQAYNVFVTTAFLLTFGIPLIALMNRDFGILGIAHVLPRVISYLLTFSLAGLFPSRFILEKLYGPPPKEKGKVFFYWHYFEQVLLTINMLTFNFLPYIQAQFEMMLGRIKTDHMVTPKVRNQ